MGEGKVACGRRGEKQTWLPETLIQLQETLIFIRSLSRSKNQFIDFLTSFHFDQSELFKGWQRKKPGFF